LSDKQEEKTKKVKRRGVYGERGERESKIFNSLCKKKGDEKCGEENTSPLR